MGRGQLIVVSLLGRELHTIRPANVASAQRRGRIGVATPSCVLMLWKKKIVKHESCIDFEGGQRSATPDGNIYEGNGSSLVSN